MPALDFSRRDRSITPEELQSAAAGLREDILRELGASKSGHPGGSLSAIDMLTVLYLYKMRHDPSNPKWADRDRFLLSKGHAAPALYAVLARCGYFPAEELGTLRKMGSRLQGHPDPNKLPGVEIPGGPEGIGLSEGIGMALGARLDGRDHKVYVMMGDGEMDEGEVWEAAMCAAKFMPGNLIGMVDMNGVQQEGTTDDIMPTKPLAEKWKAFGWNVIQIDGNEIREIIQALDEADKTAAVPTVIIASTIKGKGVDFMEGKFEYHGKVPDKAMLDSAIDQVRRQANNGD